jgi:hypothetical protein
MSYIVADYGPYRQHSQRVRIIIGRQGSTRRLLPDVAGTTGDMPMIYGPNNLPLEITFKVRPANRPDMPQVVANSVADFCRANGITEEMIGDVSMEPMHHGDDASGSYTHVRVRFTYR